MLLWRRIVRYPVFNSIKFRRFCNCTYSLFDHDVEPLYPYNHPFYVNCSKGNIYHADKEKIEYITDKGYTRIRHPLINDNKSVLKSELIYNHDHKQTELDRHLKIIHLNNDLRDHRISNLKAEVYSSNFDKRTGRVLKSPKIRDLSGFEQLLNYPKYLVSIELGIIIDKQTCCPPHHIARGYVNVQMYDNGQRVLTSAHRVIYEHVHGKIPAGYHIHHINNDKWDNRISNLQLLTPKQHTAKTIKDGKHNWFQIDVKPKTVPVIATNIYTQEAVAFPSMYKASKYLQINSGSISYILNPDYSCSKAWSKSQQAWFTFTKQQNDDYLCNIVL